MEDKETTRHEVDVLLDTGISTNLISARCCTRMGLKAPLPSTETIMGFGGKKIKTLGWVKLKLQVGGVVRKIKCNSTPDLQDICMVLSRKTCKDYGFMSNFPPRNTDRAGLRDVLWNPVTCLLDKQGESETADTENPTKVDDPPQDSSRTREYGAWRVMMNKFTSNLYNFAED